MYARRSSRRRPDGTRAPEALRPLARPDFVLALQRTAGNARVTRLLRQAAVDEPLETAAPYAGRAEFMAGVTAEGASVADDRRGISYLESLALDEIADVVRELCAAGQGVVARLLLSAGSERVRFALEAGVMRGQQGRLEFEDEHTREIVALSAEAEGVERVLGLLGRAVKELEEMKACAGYQALGDDERAQLAVLVGGSTSASRGQSDALRKLLDDPRADKADPETFRKFLRATPQTFAVTLTDRRRMSPDALTITPAGDAPGHPYRSGAADAVWTTAEIRGESPDGAPVIQTIDIFAPKAFTPEKQGLGLPSAENVARVLAETPYEARQHIVQVDIHPRRNPDDASYNRTPGYAQAGGGDFRSFMTAGAGGVVDIFPHGAAADLVTVESSLLHESGHVVSMKAWGEDVNGPSWAPWREAMANDGAKLSKYATASVFEDFGEAWSLFIQAHRKPREGEVRTLMPHRFAIMEGLVKA